MGHDVAGTAIATATFESKADTHVIDAVTELQLSCKSWPIFPIDASAINYPFPYSDDEWTGRGALASSIIKIATERCTTGQEDLPATARPEADTLDHLSDEPMLGSVAYFGGYKDSRM